jgi:hypothetical protein
MKLKESAWREREREQNKKKFLLYMQKPLPNKTLETT